MLFFRLGSAFKSRRLEARPQYPVAQLNSQPPAMAWMFFRTDEACSVLERRNQYNYSLSGLIRRQSLPGTRSTHP